MAKLSECAQCCPIFYLAISGPKLSQCAKCECTGVSAFFSGSFLRNVNTHKMWVAGKWLYTWIKCVSMLVLFHYVFAPIVFLHEMFKCAKCSSAPDVSSSQVIMYLHQLCMMLSPSPPHHFPFLQIWSIPPHTIPTTFYLSIMNFKGVQTWVGGDTPHALSYFAFFTAFPFSPSSRSLPSHIGASQMHHILLS